MKKTSFKRRMAARISTRTHMSLILLATMASGIVTSKLLFLLGLGMPMLRYGIAVAVSYGMFFLFVRLWLQIVFGKKSNSDSVSDVLEVVDVSSGQNLGAAPTSWSGSGGSFSGGGASTSWENSNLVAASVPASPSVESSSDIFEKAPDIGDLDEGLILVALVALIAAVFGSAAYIVYQAPEILLEAAFEVFLAAGLIRKARRLQSDGWALPILKGTWGAFAVVLVMALSFGWFIQAQCPQARSFAEYWNLCRSQD